VIVTTMTMMKSPAAHRPDQQLDHLQDQTISPLHAPSHDQPLNLNLVLPLDLPQARGEVLNRHNKVVRKEKTHG
jgi:hypothetical protein